MDAPLGLNNVSAVSKLLEPLSLPDLKSLVNALGLSPVTIKNNLSPSFTERCTAYITDWINNKDFVPESGGATFSALLKCLHEANHHGIANEVEKEIESGNLKAGQPSPSDKPIDVEEKLREGGVPPQKNVHVERRETTARVREELCGLKDEDGWVVLHGLGGFGKTTLAAQAVRNRDILQAFPGGVFYLAIGDKVTDDAILHKIHSLLMFFGEKEYRPASLEEASTYLRKLKHPLYLLILDDVWSPEVSKNFEFSRCVMVTSRFKDITNSVSRVRHVSVSEGVSEEEGKILLGRWIGKDPKSLPSQADTILQCCRGSPFAIALIGALLRKNPQESKLKAISETLVQKSVGKVSKHGGIGADYRYKTVNASIELSVKHLPEYLTEYFQMLVVFGYNTAIPSDALATVWGVETWEVDDLVEALIGYSLVQEGSPGSDCRHYIVHDLIMDYLHQTIPQQEQTTLHNAVIERYSEKCNGEFPTLAADGYVHYKLLSHVKAAGNQVLLGKLMSSLDWLIATIVHSDPFTVLGNYRMYKNSVSEQFLAKVQSFDLFLGNNLDNLSRIKHGDDVVQLALFQSDKSEIYQQAVSTVHGDCKRTWLKWSNKAVGSESTCILKLKMHGISVCHCQYSQDGSRVVSCSGDGTVKLWESTTGTVLQEFSGHEDWVRCCALSRSGSLIVSSSADCTVKVWDVQSKQLLVNFTQHKDWVWCCDFSPNEKLVVSGDNKSCVMVWEARTGEVNAKWLIHGSESEGVYSCAFSPSGDRILTGSEKGAIMLWTLKGDLLTQYKGHSHRVRCVVFRHDGKQMASACGDSTAKIWDVDKGDCVHTLPHPDRVWGCDFSPDGSRLVTAVSSGYLKIWSAKEGHLLQGLEVQSSDILCACYSPSDQHILMADNGGYIKILRSEESNQQQSLSVQYHSRFSVYFEKVGMKYEAVIVCTSKEDNKVKVVYGSGTAAVVATLPTLEGHTLWSWRISNTGTMVVVGYGNGTLQLISLTYNEDKWEVNELWQREDAHTECVEECYFSPDDSKIISCTEKEQKSWSTASGKELAVIGVVHKYCFLCAFFNDSIRVASASERSISIWSSVTGKEEHLLSCEDMSGDELWSIDLSQDNSRLIAVICGGDAVVWDTESWEVLLKVELQCDYSTCALSPDGSHAVTGSDSTSGNLQIWNVSEARKVHEDTITSVTWSRIRNIVFSPDGQEIVTLCGDRVDWWKIDGSHMKTLFLKAECHYDEGSIKVSPNYDIVTIDKSGSLYVLSRLVL